MIYWNLVKACLVEFHFLTKEAANLVVNSYLARIEDVETREFAKHEEAFYLACALAGKEVREPTESESPVYNRLVTELYKENPMQSENRCLWIKRQNDYLKKQFEIKSKELQNALTKPEKTLGFLSLLRDVEYLYMQVGVYEDALNDIKLTIKSTTHRLKP